MQLEQYAMTWVYIPKAEMLCKYFGVDLPSNEFLSVTGQEKFHPFQAI